MVCQTVGTAVPAQGMEFEDLLERQDGHPTLQAILAGPQECG